jgi:hypothetical protein
MHHLHNLVHERVPPGPGLGHADREHLEPHLQLDQRPLEARLGALGAHTRFLSQPDRVQRAVLQRRLVDRLSLGRHQPILVLLEVIVGR